MFTNCLFGKMPNMLPIINVGNTTVIAREFNSYSNVVSLNENI